MFTPLLACVTLSGYLLALLYVAGVGLLVALGIGVFVWLAVSVCSGLHAPRDDTEHHLRLWLAAYDLERKAR